VARTIRPFAEPDLEQVLDVWYRSSVIAHSFLPAEFFVAERREIAERWLPESATAVCEINGQVVGFVSMIGNEVGGIFVDPEHQRRGIGRSLLDHVGEFRGFLELGVFEANLAGRRFYEAYGFRLVGREIGEATGHVELRLRFDDPGE
jgi:putative acetyltransferase